MSDWIYLEVAIGLILVYFIVSLLCSTLTELIARWLALRARTLKDGIYKLLNDPKKDEENSTDKLIFKHPLFKGLSPLDDGTSHWWDSMHLGKWYLFKKFDGPSGIPPGTFAQIIFDTLMDAGENSGSGYAAIPASTDAGSDAKGRSKSLLKASRVVVGNLGKNIELLSFNDDTKKVLKSLLTLAKTKATNWEDVIIEFRTSLEKWFDDSMQRVTGWYKRKTQLIVLVLALGIVFCLNIDSFGIASSLYNNPALRETVVAAAEAQVTSNFTAESANLTFSDTLKKLDALALPIGWNTEKDTTNANPNTVWGWLLKIAGILVTALAASLGSGFWFDLLNKLVNIRAAGKTPEKTDATTSGSE
jgi:hypothetical protein